MLNIHIQKKLLNALPKLHEKKQPKPHVNWQTSSNQHKPLIEVTHLSKEFELGRGQTVKAVNDLSFHIYWRNIGISGRVRLRQIYDRTNDFTAPSAYIWRSLISRNTHYKVNEETAKGNASSYANYIPRSIFLVKPPKKKSLILLGRH